LITLTTVGYGDFFPKTSMGRLVGVIICIWGVFIVSFFVVNLNIMIAFNNNEEKAYVMHLKLHYKQELKKKAIDVLASAYKRRNAKMKDPDN
jgi:potassium intermediate/small conductance calcium-activated channel subfamily N protein 2